MVVDRLRGDLFNACKNIVPRDRAVQGGGWHGERGKS